MIILLWGIKFRSRHTKRCSYFVDVKEMLPRAEEVVIQDTNRISWTPFWYDEHAGSNRRKSDVHQSAICWVNSVGVLIYTYLSVPPNGPDGPECCTMDGVFPHLNRVEFYARLDSKAFGRLNSRLVDAESSIRHERNRLNQQDNEISLHDAIELVKYYKSVPHYNRKFRYQSHSLLYHIFPHE